MSDFEPAFQLLIKQEGRYVDNKDDPGGPTNYGLSLRFIVNEGLVNPNFDGHHITDATSLHTITIDCVRDIYLQAFWHPLHLDSIVNQRIADMILSMTVNTGIHQGVVLLQRAINYIVPRLKLVEDGLLGPMTVKSVNARFPDALFGAYQKTALEFYDGLCSKKPSLRPFLRGWINRVRAL